MQQNKLRKCDCVYYNRTRNECYLTRLCAYPDVSKCSFFKTEEQRYAEKYG